MSGKVYEWKDFTSDDTLITAHVCIIGSGCGGATVAHKLGQQGANVVILEQGGYYPTQTFDQDELNMNGKISADRSLRTSSDGGTSLLSGHNVGGASVHYWADSFRTPKDRLELWAKGYGIEGHDLAALTPAWDELTSTLNVHPAKDEYFNRMNQLVKEAAEKLHWEGERVPQARKNCQKSGHCMQGCLYEAKQSQLVTHLRQAVDHGARIYSDVRAETLAFQGNGVRTLYGSVIDRAKGKPSGRKIRVEAKAYVLAAGGYNSAAFLMRNGFKETHPMLGKHFAFNPSPMVHALYNEDIVLWRNIPAAFGIEHFRLAKFTDNGKYVEGGYLLMPNQLQPGTLAATIPYVGERHAHWMNQLHRIGSTIGWIDDYPKELGEIVLDSSGATRVNYPFGEVTTAMIRDLVSKQIQLHFAAGASEIVVSGSQGITLKPGDSLSAIEKMHVTAGGLHMGAPHPSGGCIMGSNIKSSVVDSTHRVHGKTNLFVADSSVFPTSASVDPSFTIMAFSYIAAKHIQNHISH